MEDHMKSSCLHDGGRILELANIKMKQYEAPDELYKRLLSCVEQSLLMNNSGLLHHGEIVYENEKISPLLENVLIVIWLNLIHHELPRLVKRKFEALLQTNTLASIRPKISQSLHMLLGEILTSYSTVDTTNDSLRNVQQPMIKNPPLRCHLCKHSSKSSQRHDSASQCQNLQEKTTKVKKASRKERDKEKNENRNEKINKELKVNQKRASKKSSSSNKKSKNSSRGERCKTSVGSNSSNIGNELSVNGRERTVKNNHNNKCDDDFGNPYVSQNNAASTYSKNSNSNLDRIIDELAIMNNEFENNDDFGTDTNMKRTYSSYNVNADSTDVYVFNDVTDERNDRKSQFYDDYTHGYDVWANCDVFGYDKDNLDDSFYFDSDVARKNNLDINNDFTGRENYDLSSENIEKHDRVNEIGINGVDNIVNDDNRFDIDDTTFYFDSCSNNDIHHEYKPNTKVENEVTTCFERRDNFCELDTKGSKDEPPGTVTIKQSPFFHAYYKNQPLKITIDSGAETNMIKERLARQIGITITKTTQQATQADGQSPLTIIGETRMSLTRNSKCFFLEALVVENIDVDILAGVPFMTCNDVSVRPAKQQIIIGDGTIYEYGAITLNIDSPTPSYSPYDLDNMTLENNSLKELGEFSQEIKES